MPTITVSTALETTTVTYTDPAAQPTTATVFGANCGGYSGETAQHAFTRISGHWKLGMVRWWANSIFNRANAPSYLSSLPLMIELDAPAAEVKTGSLDSQIAACLATVKPGDIVVLNHEFDNGGNLADEVPAQAHFGQLCLQHLPAGAHSTLILMGQSYINGNWRNCWPVNTDGIDYVGSDSYQHGTSDPGDSAAKVLQPVYDAAASLGKPVAFGELGARNLLSDGARAKFLTDAAAMMGANPTAAALYYESYRGSLGPWNLLETSSTSGVFSPEAANVWANACASN